MCRVHFLRLRHKVTEEMVSEAADQLEFMMIEGHVPLEEAWKPVYDAFKRLRSQGDAGHNFKRLRHHRLGVQCLSTRFPWSRRDLASIGYRSPR
jgi:hypothetical protein